MDDKFESILWEFADANVIPTPIGTQCGKCEFKTDEPEKKTGFKECWEEQTPLRDHDFKKPLIFDLWNFRKKEECIENKIYLLADIPAEYIGNLEKPQAGEKLTNNQRQWLQIEKVKNNDDSAYLDLVGLREELDTHIYPLHFIDFETSMVAIPFHKGRRPYEQIAFQYSHHIMEEDGTVKHASEFISVDRGKFPNCDFLRSLKKDLEQDNGTIFRYSNHENTVLNQIKRQLNDDNNPPADRDELIAFIDSITHEGDKRIGERDMVDLCEIVKNYYYDPYTNGSNSIKYVLPAVLNRSEYLQERYSKPIYGDGCEMSSLNFKKPQIWIKKNEKGEIINPYKQLPPLFEGIDDTEDFITDETLAEGGASMTAYAKMQFTEMSDEERKKVKEGLLRYCELDTLAMVMIYEYWLSELTSRPLKSI